jgi:hypothetical protein
LLAQTDYILVLLPKFDYMKRIVSQFTLTAVFLLATTVSSFGQKSAVDRAVNKMCDYIKKNQGNQKLETRDDVVQFFGKAFVAVCSNDLEALMAELGFEKFDKETGEKIGVQIGIKLASTCPDYMEMIKLMMGTNTPKAANESNVGISGYVESIDKSNYVVINIRNADKKVYKVYWIENFEGAEKLNNNPLIILNRNIKLRYAYKELFNSKDNTFSTEKVITSLSLD